MRVHTVKRKAAWDRRKTAIHEAGHLIMAGHFRVLTLGAHITPSFTTDPAVNRFWVGEARWYTKAPARALRMVAVAGSVASDIWDGNDFYSDEWYDEHVMSDSDWAGAGCEPGKPSKAVLSAIEKAYDLFDPSGPLWRDVVEKSRELIVHSRVYMRMPEYIASMSAAEKLAA